MLRAVLIDDEENSLIVLSKLLKDFVTIPVKVLGTAKNLVDGIELINSVKPDVIFLDIDMPGKSGMEIFNYFPKPDFRIIFVTAYNQYAITALKNSASDYILKPVNFLELREAINKVADSLEEQQHVKELEDKVNMIFPPDMDGQNILFEVNSGFVIENSKNIEYCYAEKAYSVIVTFSGSTITVSKPLKELQEQLPSKQFFRTHKSYLVNVFYIRRFVRAKESYVILKSGKKIPVSSRKCSIIIPTIKEIIKP